MFSFVAPGFLGWYLILQHCYGWQILSPCRVRGFISLWQTNVPVFFHCTRLSVNVATPFGVFRNRTSVVLGLGCHIVAGCAVDGGPSCSFRYPWFPALYLRPLGPLGISPHLSVFGGGPRLRLGLVCRRVGAPPTYSSPIVYFTCSIAFLSQMPFPCALWLFWFGLSWTLELRRLVSHTLTSICEYLHVW